MVIPEEREADYERKMKSPLFSEHFQKDNWTLVYFNALREAFTKTRDRQVWSRSLARKGPRPMRRNAGYVSYQQRLMEFGGADAPEPPGSITRIQGCR